MTWDLQKFVEHITCARLDGQLNVGSPVIRFFSKILAASPHSMCLERVIRYFNFELTVEDIKKKEYFNGFFGENSRKRKLKRAFDEKHVEDQKI